MEGGVFHSGSDSGSINTFTPTGTPNRIALLGADNRSDLCSEIDIAAAFEFNRVLNDDEVKAFWYEAMDGYPTLLNRGSRFQLAEVAAAGGHPMIRRKGLWRFGRPVEIGREGVLVF